MLRAAGSPKPGVLSSPEKAESTGKWSPESGLRDGANIWVANFGSNNVIRLRASDGAVLGIFGVGTGPIGIAFDGANIRAAGSGQLRGQRARRGAARTRSEEPGRRGRACLRNKSTG